MNNILFITRHDPYVRSGGGLATKAFINAFSYLYPSKVDVLLADNCNIDNSVNARQIIKVKSRSFISRALSLITGSLHRFKTKTKSLINSSSYDICILDGSIVSGDMVEYINKKNIKTITIHHNYEPQYHKENKTLDSFKGHFLYYIKRNEKQAYLNSHINLFLTQYDLNLFEKKYGKSKGQSYVIGIFEPHSPKEIYYTELNESCQKRPVKLVISGTLGSYQTENGIMQFYNNYFNSLDEVLGDFNLTLTGRNPSSLLYKTIGQNKNVSIIPNPINIEKEVLNNDIFVCPTCIGGGLKLRVMDGLKVGLPILVHEVSARGYDYFFKHDWFQIYNDTESFITAIKKINRAIKEIDRNKIIEEYNNYFSFEAGVKRLKSCLANCKL